MFDRARALVRRGGKVPRSVAIAVVLLMPMGFVTFGYVDIQRDQVAVSTRERAGAAYLRPALALLAEVTRARTGDPDAERSLPASVAAVDDAEARYAGPADVTAQWGRVRAALPPAGRAGDGRRSDAYAAASTALLRLVVAVSDTSKLTLDPDLDTYYLMDALVFRLPVLLDLSGQVTGAGRLDLAKISGVLRVTQAAVESGMATVRTATGRATWDRIEATAQVQRRSLGDLLAGVDRAVRGGGPTSVRAELGAATEAVVRLVAVLLPQLDALLTTRIGGLAAQAYRVRAAALLGTLMVAVLVFRFHRSAGGRRRALRHASLVRHAAAIANSADTFADAAGSVQRVVCAELGWLAGHAWTTAAGSAVWHLADHRHPRTGRCELRVRAEGGWLPDQLSASAWTRVAAGPQLADALGAAGCGVVGAVTVPVLAGGEVAGVMAFYLPAGAEYPQSDLMSSLEQVGLALGRVVERQRTSATLIHQANHDAVTGLANRWRLLDAMDAARQRSAAGRPHGAILLVNLDRFALINDSWGYAAGDLVLQQVAGRLLGAVGPDDLVARLGADEFAVLTDAAAGADGLAQRLLQRLHENVVVMGHPVPLRASVGICAVTGEEDGRGDSEGVLRDADAALRQAKLRGRDQVCTFDAALRSTAAARLSDEAALAVAIMAGELELHYQPIMRLETGQPAGAEALVRWSRPGHGMVPPDRFIGLAEDSGLIMDLGRWVLRQACRDAAAWWYAVPALAEATVSVNVSTRQLIHPRFLTDLDEALRDAALPPARLIVEITESALIGDPDAVMATLQAIRRRGVQLALDDFGTGYSSLSYVQHLPVTILKIDKSFVDPITGPGRGTTLSEVVLKLAEATGLRTVAEGVETRGQAEALRLLGCHSGQGFTWSRPVPLDALAATLAGLMDLAGDPRP